MGKIVDLTGLKYGRLTVLEPAGKSKHGTMLWTCKCDCGNEIITESNSIRRGKTMSCGCLVKEKAVETGARKRLDLTGKRFGHYVVVKKCENHIQVGGQNKTAWLCRCKCGAEKKVLTTTLIRGRIKSCGCKQFNNDLYKGTRISMLGTNMKIACNNKSGVKGVCWDKTNMKWSAYIYLSKKRYRLGYFNELEDAINARKLAEEKLFDPILKEYATMTEAGE